MIEEPIGLRIYSKEYCRVLFPPKWHEHCAVIPWFFVVKLLGGDVIGRCGQSFSLRKQSLELPIDILPTDTGIKLAPGQGRFRLLWEGHARDRFKVACTSLGGTWADVEGHLIKLVDGLYKEHLIFAEACEKNGAVLRTALEEEESVDLRLRLSPEKQGG